MKKSYRKVAIFYDWINQWGGAERVLLDILKIFPNADLLTFYYRPQNWLPKNTKIITPPFNLKKYDLVISTTSYFGYLINANIYYFHNTNRHFNFKFADKFLLPKNRIYLCNSQNVKKRIKKHFGVDAKIVYPGINIKKFVPIKNPNKNYYLIVSRFVPYKKINLAIIACQELGKKLIVIGTGRQEKYLKNISNKKYIQFLGKIKEKDLINYYQNAKALIFPQLEDFGLTAIESQACGRPVIAYKAGGALETIIENQTGIFFENQTIESLKNAIKKFEKQKFSSSKCHNNSLKFSNTRFMLNFKKQLK